MRFYSTSSRNLLLGAREAVLQGLAADKGLFMPEKIPCLPQPVLKQLDRLSLQEIAFETAKLFFGDSIPRDNLREIVYEAINFPAPLVRVRENIYSLELFHGPTLAFKDFGARFMAQMTAALVKDSGRRLFVLVATSGDTGSAVANGFLGMPRIEVILLYPKGKVSKVQEMQLTTLGRNVTALEIEGVFDDCQALVKAAFVDDELRAAVQLSSANSINIARLIPQSFYYLHAFGQLGCAAQPLVFSVPSGNFGNLTGGLLAKRMGLPVSRFIAATNINDVVPEYLKNGLFVPRPSLPTMSNAMDVGSPSNFARMLDLYDGSVEKMRKDLWGASFNDEETKAAICATARDYGYLLDPHGAVAYLALCRYMEESGTPGTGVFLETAHPAKFIDAYAGMEQQPQMPESLRQCLDREKSALPMPADFAAFKKYLLSRAE